MRPAILALIACAVADTAEAVRIVRGPWWWHSDDGAAVAVAVAGVPAVPASAQLDGAGIALTGEVRSLADRSDGADHVLILRLARGASGRLRVEIGGQAVTAHLHRAPLADGPARIALAGGRAWPSRADLDALSASLGGQPHTVLALGDGIPARLGTGGWESEIPVAVVAPASVDLAACSGGQDQRWRHGLRIGVLGLPASPERGRADLALARDLSPWLVYLDVPAGWDPAIGRQVPSDPRDLGVLLAACQRLEVPLALGAGGAGLVSEPLRLQAGGAVEVSPGGVRYVLPVPAVDDGLARITPTIALPLEQPLLAGLTADLGSLHLHLLRPGDPDAVQLSWQRDARPDADDPAALGRAVAAAETLDAPAVRDAMLRWSWLPRPVLAAAMPDASVMARLREEGGAQGRALARRLALMSADEPGSSQPAGDPDPMEQRDLLLWRIGSVRGADAASWRRQAASTADAMVLRALLADVARDPERLLMPVLVERVLLQAAGTLPPDPDPLDQHRLFALVFDDVRLSPTPLRAAAVALRERADPLARGPIERFIARHGAERPVP